MGLFSKKTKTTSNETASTQIDPFIKQYGQGTLNMFDALTSGVMNRYQQQPGMVRPTNGMNNIFQPGDPRRDMTMDQLNSPEIGQETGLLQPGLQPGGFPMQVGGPSSFVAPFSADTLRYLQQSGQFTGSGGALRDIAGGVTGGNIAQIADPGSVGMIGDPGSIDDIQIAPVAEVQARRGSEFMGDYLNPYTGQVVDASLADYDVGVDRTQNAMRARRDAGSAFGDRAAIADAVYGGEAARGRGALSAGLRADAFNTAATFGAGDAGRFTSASAQNAAAANARAQAQAQLQRQGQMANVSNRLALGGMNADIAGTNIANRLALGGMNADIAGQNIANANSAAALRGNLLQAGDAADIARLGVLGEAGRVQDDRAQRELGEPLELLKLRQALLSGTPYDQTVTSSGTSTNKSSGGLGSLLLGNAFQLGSAYLGR